MVSLVNGFPVYLAIRWFYFNSRFFSLSRIDIGKCGGVTKQCLEIILNIHMENWRFFLHDLMDMRYIFVISFLSGKVHYLA